MRRHAVLLAGAALILGLACTVDSVVGSNAVLDGGGDGGPDGGNDAGTPICPGTGVDCNPVCGSQICRIGCSGLSNCVTQCGGDAGCSLSCKRPEGSTCTPSCDPGPCTMSCTPVGEEGLQCNMSCNPEETCLADCHGGTCTVACGELEPAFRCDAGVYSCSEACGL